MLIALTRAVPTSIVHCELTHIERTPIDYSRAVRQHEEYERALESLGCRVERLPDTPDLPDSVFVEDPAIVLDTVAAIARSGAESRRGETSSVAEALKQYREIVFVADPGVIDGGDVLRVGRRIYAGLSTRTSPEGIRQLENAARRDGLTVIPVRVGECLHLKSAVTTLDHCRPAVLVNADWIDPAIFEGADIVDVDPDEPTAANVLLVGDTVLCAAEFPRTRQRLEERGFRTMAAAAGELAKAEGGLTCGSIVFSVDAPRRRGPSRRSPGASPRGGPAPSGVV
jgi:dimethylargininase